MTKNILGDLLDFYSILSNISLELAINQYEGVRYPIIVKRKGFLISDLKEASALISKFHSLDSVEFSKISEKIDEWIEYLNENYSSKSKWLKLPEELRTTDVKRLERDIDKILEKILYIADSINISRQKNTSKQISNKLLKLLDKTTRSDLNEGYHAYNEGLPTAAYMLFFRVAEDQVKSYYKKVTGITPINKNWGDMLHELLHDHKPKVNKRLTNLLYYLKDKRNEAQHPGKHFKDQDCEKILHYLTDLMDEIKKS